MPKSASSLPTCSHIRDSKSSHASNLSDHQASILKEKESGDEIEGLRRRRHEDKELDDQLKCIDEKDIDAQHRQEDAHKGERELADRLT